MDAPPALSTFRERINWIRATRGGLSLRALSLAAGLSHSTLGNLVRDEADGTGRQMDAETARSLAEFAGVSIEWLLTGESAPTKPVAPATEATTSPKRATEARRRASRALVELDGIDEKEAAFILQNVDLPDGETDDALSYYLMARCELAAPNTLSVETVESNGRDVSPAAPSHRQGRKRR